MKRKMYGKLPVVIADNVFAVAALELEQDGAAFVANDFEVVLDDCRLDPAV